MGAPALLLLHGWGGSVYQWRKNIPSLVAAGFRVCGLDFPGHGLSDKPADARHYTLDALVSVVRHTLDAVRLDRVSLIGQSLGGAVAIRFALDHPERVRRLVLISTVGVASPLLVTTFGRFVPAVFASLLPHVATRWLVAAILHSAVGGPERPTRRDVDEVWAASSDPSYAGALLHLVRSIRWQAPTADELRGIAAPVLVISGERDLIASPRRLRGIIGDMPNIRLEVIPRGGHAVNEGNPQMVNPLMIDFLSGSVAFGATTV